MSSTTKDKIKIDKKDELPSCFISSPFEDVYGRFSVYKKEKDGKTFKNMSLAIYNGKQFHTKKTPPVPYNSMLLTLSGAKELRDSLDDAINLIEVEIAPKIDFSTMEIPKD